jgi:hypothetical protein
MNLAKCDEPMAPGSADLPEKRGPVSFYRRPRVVFGEAEVEIAFAVGARGSSRARGKSMQQPGELVQVLCAENRKFGFVWGPGWHRSMLPEASK